MCKKSIGKLMYINRIKDNFDKQSRITVIHSLFLSNIYYGLKVWGTANATNIQHAQKVQNFAAKVALGGTKFDHATPYINELKWLKINKMYQHELAVIVYNVINKRSPCWLFSLPKVRDTHTLNTRHKHDLYVPKAHTRTGKRSAVISGPKLWNSLPCHVKNAKCLSTFKRNLKTYLLKSWM